MERLLTIWRVENEFGFGPYNGKGNILSFMSGQAKNAHLHVERCPAPWKDGALCAAFRSADHFKKCGHLRSGFASVSSYHTWFPSAFIHNALDATGFFLTRYAVPRHEALYGDRQVVFDKRKSTITGFRRCNEAGILTDRSALTHKPIKRFLRDTGLPLALD